MRTPVDEVEKADHVGERRVVAFRHVRGGLEHGLSEAVGRVRQRLPDGRRRDADPRERGLGRDERRAHVAGRVARRAAVVRLQRAVEGADRATRFLDGHLRTERGLRRDAHPAAPHAERRRGVAPHVEIGAAIVAVGAELLGGRGSVARVAHEQGRCGAGLGDRVGRVRGLGVLRDRGGPRTAHRDREAGSYCE